MSNLIGQSLGRYHILEQLGEGGMAIVYKAYDTRLEADVAVKVIRTENILPNVLERALKRFEREAKSLAQLTHPNIVKVTDYGEYDGKPYLIMPYLPGGTLKSKLTGKPMHWQEAARILIPIADALGYAHQHDIIHRDVKPSNILITENGQPMLADFGVAKLLDAVETIELTGTGVGIGTPEYMAPEQATNKMVDARADIYALGVVFFELVTGRKPYIADTPMAVLIMHSRDPLPRPRSFAPNLPQEVENILLKSLAKNPEDRYQDMAEFAKAMEGLAAGSGVARGEAWLPKLAARRPWRIAAVLAGMAVVAGIIGFALRGNSATNGKASTPTALLAVRAETTTTLPETITAMPETATASPTEAGEVWMPSANFIYDDFNAEGVLNPALWANGCGESVTQVNGVLRLGVKQLKGSCSVLPVKPSNSTIQALGAFEAQIRISNDFHGSGQAFITPMFRSRDAPGGHWWASCGLMASSRGVEVNFNVQNFAQQKVDYNGSLPAAFDTWYTIRLETDPKTMAFSCYVDGKLIKTVIPGDAETLRSAHFQREIESWRGKDVEDDPSAAQATTYLDNVRIFPGGTDLSTLRSQPTAQPSDPTLYDDFSNPAYDEQINTALWTSEAETSDTLLQRKGILTLRNSGGPMRGTSAVALKYGWFTLSQPIFFQADVMMDAVEHAGAIFIYFRNDPGGSGPFQEVMCGIDSQAGADDGKLSCWDRWNKDSGETSEDEYSAPIAPRTGLGVWHTVRIAIDPATMTLTYFIDGQEAGAHIPVRAEDLKNDRFMFAINTHARTAASIIGYVDNVRVGTFGP